MYHNYPAGMFLCISISTNTKDMSASKENNIQDIEQQISQYIKDKDYDNLYNDLKLAKLLHSRKLLKNQTFKFTKGHIKQVAKINISMLHVEDNLKQKAQNIIDEFPRKHINPYDFEITAVINLRNRYFQQQSIQSDMFHALDLFSKIAICSYHYDHEREGLQQLLKEWLDSRVFKSTHTSIVSLHNIPYLSDINFTTSINVLDEYSYCCFEDILQINKYTVQIIEYQNF